MKAVICTKYGPPEVLILTQVEKPVPKDNEILVAIKATAVNSGDVRVRALAVEGFLKIVMRFVLGFTKPRKPILGTVFSGIVAQVGSKVQNFSAGDEVYGITGFRFGTYAEYIAVAEKSVITHKPANATFEEAAAILFGGQTAIYFLQKAKIAERVNPSVLIYGATGAVGTAAVQLAKYYHARVTAVCSSNGQDLANKLGADKVILYDKEDLSQIPEKFDIFFDAVGKAPQKQALNMLNKGGSYQTVGGLDVADDKIEQLQLLRTLFEQGSYQATIDRVFTLDEIVEAHRYVDTGRKKGNVVVKIP
ncbi:NAD(P)-dependent alcohol dehydrogenase [Sphingobacteriales bacterium UPWRP_1]|nr:NAD(P)-dependent alcohol dehydrogenase [Sphingobacteriales bacterium TSM_CSM]PSJ78093.1 NAD(P)-dependent alcohol dehydrogenase [Sphingobacteriales bacterium UPWRP_1]